MKAINWNLVSVLAQLVAGVILIQYHSVIFWSLEIDPVIGWALSIMLEVVVLSFWFARHWMLSVLALFATALLLAGPFYLKAEPLIDQLLVHNEAKQRSIEARIASQEAVLEQCLSNSEKRTGWLPCIEEAQDELQRLDQALASSKDTSSLAWKQITPVVMYLTVLLLVQVNNVRMIRTLSTMRWRRVTRYPW